MDDLPVERLSLLMRHGPKPGLRILLPRKGRIFIGRDDTCHLTVDDTGLSRRHCKLEIEDTPVGTEVTVEDLGSRNGTFVNRRPIEKPVRLQPGDRLYIGNTVLEVQFKQPRQIKPELPKGPRPPGATGGVDDTAVFQEDEILRAAAADAAAHRERMSRGTGSEAYEPIDFASSTLDLPSMPITDGHTEEMQAFRQPGTPGHPAGDYRGGQSETEEIEMGASSDVLSFGVQVLGPYRLVELLFEGPHCPVFRVVHQIMVNPYAMKVLPPEHAHGSTLKRFKHEAVATSRFDHDNIRRLVNAGEDQGYQYLVYEFVDGPDLGEMIEFHGVMDLETALGMGVQLAEAIRHMHASGVIHRNVMPNAILIDVDGTAVLSDLGLAEFNKEPGAVDDLLDEDTPAFELAFRAPELLADPLVTGTAVDIYGLSGTLYFALTGRPPHDPRKPHDLVRAITEDDPTPLSKLLRDIPAELGDYLMTGMSRDPSARPSSAEEMLDRLQAFLEQM